MGCNPSSFEKKSKIKPIGQNGSKTTSKNGKANLRVNRTTSRPNDSVVDEGAISNQNSSNHLDEDENGEPIEKQSFFGTDVSVEWLVKKLCEHFKCPVVSKPQWILERLNKYTEKDLDHTRVLKVTFGWDHDVLPKSVVLKISSKPLELKDQTPDSKLALRMFKKECNIYEWLQKQKKASVPKIFLMQKNPTDDCQESIILMEDIADRASAVDWEDEISVEAVRDLLRLLAQVHAASRLQQAEWTPIIHANTMQFYKGIAAFIENVAAGWAEIGEERFKKLLELTSANYMAKIVNNACKKMKCEPCLVHGNPNGRNFFLTNRKEIAAIIDWTQVHPGCFGEDVAKAICWNLTPKERQTHIKKLLESYHFNLLKYSEGNAKDITLETVENAYNHFFPLAAVNYLMFLPEEQLKSDPKMLERAQALIEESLAMFIDSTPLETSDDPEANKQEVLDSGESGDLIPPLSL